MSNYASAKNTTENSHLKPTVFPENSKVTMQVLSCT